MKTPQLPVVLLAHELKANGASPSAIATRCASGQLVRLRRGAYLSTVVNQELTEKDWALAHHLAAVKLYRKSALSHASAALLWGAPLTTLPATIHLSTPTVSKRRRHRVTLHVQRPEVVARAQRHRGVRVTTPQDTVADCTRTLPLVDALIIADWFLFQQQCTHADLETALSAIRGKGSASARILLQVVSAQSESPAESLAMLRLWQAGLCLPTQQLWLESYTGYRYRPDMVWEELRLILEIDGHIKFQGLYRPAHEQAGYDAMRQRELEIMGWSVMRTTWKELYEHPATLIARLRAAGVLLAQK